MNETHKGINYDLAKAEADKVDEEIIAALQNGSFITSFRSKIGSCNYPSSTCISCAHIAMDTLDRCGANIITLTVPLALDQFIFSVNIGETKKKR